MAIPSFCESFGAADMAQLVTRYEYYNTGGSGGFGVAVIDTTAGRGGGRGLSMATGGTPYFGKAVAAGNTSVVMGIRFRIITTSGSRILMTVRHQANAVNHLTLLVNSSGYLELRRGNASGTLLATGTTFIPFNTVTSVNLKASINSSTGSFSVQVNGVSESSMTGTSQNTQSGASADITALYIGSQNDASLNVVFNDFYFLDGSNSLPGDVYVDYLVANGAGNYQDFTPSTGTNHAALLDEAPPNTTDYVSSATTGHKETNATANISGTASTVLFVQSVNYALKSDAGAAQLRNLIRSGSTDANGATVAMSGSARYFLAPHDVDPATGVAWTVSGVNAMEVGLENMT